jgi:hypothetical protein
MKKNYYELLEVPPDASQEQIKAAMIRLGKIYATRAQKDSTARTYFNQITEAYRTLSNPYKRTSYDDELKPSQKESNTEEKSHSRFFKWAIKGWQACKLQTMKGWQIVKQQTIKVWEIGKQPVFQRKKIAKPQTVKKSETKKLKVTNRGKIGKPQTTTKYLDKMLVPGEKIKHQARTHWFFYVDFGAVLVVIFSSYFLLISHAFVGDDMPTVLLWVPKFISKNRLEISVWYLGLIALGLMMLWEAFVIGQTTELAVTSKRILFKSGLLNRTLIEIKLRRFESIKIHQNIVGLILNYGTVTIGGMGGTKTSVPNIVAPFRLRKILWLALEDVERRDDDDLKNEQMAYKKNAENPH